MSVAVKRPSPAFLGRSVMATSDEVSTFSASTSAIELNGINVISEDERKGTARDLFWPWFAANIAVLGVSYGAFLLYFGISFWQAVIFGTIGIVFSFFLCGLVALAGKRASVPTLVVSRAVFGFHGNKVPTAVSWILTVGWETILTSLATLATATVFDRLGWGGGTATKVIGLIIVVILIIGGGVAGFDVIMRMQFWITVITAVLTVMYVVLVRDEIHWSVVSDMPSGSTQNVIGGLIFMATGFGLGWVNVAADYSRYLPRRVSSGGVVWWTTFGGALAPVILVIFGVLLAGSSGKLQTDIGNDPIGALTTILPRWFLLPFAVVAILGLVGGAVLDIYSSGLALLTLGIPIPRWSAALVDGLVMIGGTIYIVFYSDSFFFTFEAFLITLGVPIAAWCGMFLADMFVRKGPYSERDFYDPNGRYGSVQILPIVLMVVATVIGWGLVTNTLADWVHWQGYLLDTVGLGGKTGSWAGANIGVAVALGLGFFGQFAISSMRRGKPTHLAKPEMERV
jgi:nucleobase:cation symporter-1, NCS1 family